MSRHRCFDVEANHSAVAARRTGIDEKSIIDGASQPKRLGQKAPATQIEAARSQQKAPAAHQSGATPGLMRRKGEAARGGGGAQSRNPVADSADQLAVNPVEPPSGVEPRAPPRENRADNSLRSPSRP